MKRPRGDQPHYGEHLGDSDYWRPWVLAVLEAHRLPPAELDAPFVGSFPTFLVGDLVVKLFGPGFDGAASHRAELAMHRLLANNPAIPAPGLVADGQLFDDAPHWPYLVTERLPGIAVRDAHLDDVDGTAIATAVGEAAATVHRLTPPEVVAERNLLPALRTEASKRLGKFGLPAHLVAQVPEYLSDALPADTLVHADITADHVFIDGNRLVGIIDWGDSIVADPYYELVAVHFDAFRARRDLLDAFLESYGWQRDDEFTRRALQGVLEFQFNALPAIRKIIDLDSIETLDELAERLFTA